MKHILSLLALLFSFSLLAQEVDLPNDFLFKGTECILLLNFVEVQFQLYYLVYVGTMIID